MGTQNTNNLHKLIAAKEKTFQSTYPYLHDYIGVISNNTEKKLKIESIINNSERWKHDLAFWCLIDNCHDQFPTSLNITKLQNELNNICRMHDHCSSVTIINQLILQQSRDPYPCRIRHLIELFIYLQSGPNTLRIFFILCKDQSTSFQEILNKLKVLWIEVFIPESIDSRIMEALQKKLHLQKHFLQCNIDVVQNFVRSIPRPYSFDALIRLFDYFTDEINLLTIGALESFLSENTGKALDICLTQLCIAICLTHLRKKIDRIIIPARILSNMRYFVEKMLLSWSLNEVCVLMDTVQNEDDLKYMNSVLTIIVEYGLMYDRTIFNFADRSLPSSQWPLEVHAHALRVSFSEDSKMLELKELLDAIINETYPNVAERAAKRQQLSDDYDQLSREFEQFSSMDRNKLKDRLISIRTYGFYARVALIIRVSDLIFGHPMRLVQKLSILLALDLSSTSARILQINTGEGKTRIVSVLAVIKCLQGVKVDVITSSKELAKIQSEELKDFYEFFDLKVAHNADLSSENYTYGRRRKNGDLIENIFGTLGVFQPVYECDVIYGSADDFEADILRDEFDENWVRCDRRCEFALVDEVDNMMIDGRQHTLRLSSSIPSVFHLLPIKAIIWNQILQVAKMVVKTDDQWYKLCEDENGNTVPELLDESIQKFSESLILPVLKNYVHLNDTAPDRPSEKLIVPKHLHQFTSEKLSRWIRNAAHAKFEMKDGREYVLKDKKIVYVDVNNTGVLHENMRWYDGLHCFLEMKHGCSIESEHITTNFISHVTFFSRYSTNLIGLTGTVGGEATRRVFREVYSADCLIIPSFRERRHHELQARFTSKEIDWLQCIANSCEEKMRQKRAVLIITKFIEQAQKIASLLRSSFPNKVKLYTESKEKKVARDTLEAGCALVATNIVGRGTDILVSEEVERNGGLHVCITFLPDNDRVERQNQGRTSRCGNKGTSQFIINQADILAHISNESELLTEMRKQRNLFEVTQMKSAIESVKETIKKDQIFQQFSSSQETLIACFPANVKAIARNALREKFGLWLIKSSSKTDRALQESFDEFKSTCECDTLNRLINNPVYYVQMANCLLKDQKNLADAIDYLNKAIQMDPHCTASAYFSRGYARALQYKETRDLARLENAISNFEEARRIIKDVLDPALLLFPVATDNSPLHEYLIHWKTLYGTLTNSINAAIGRPVGEDIIYLKEQLKSTDIDAEKRQEFDEHLKHLENNRNQIEDGILRSVLKNKTGIKIECKRLMDSLPASEKKELYKKEIEELELNGFIGTIIFNERKPIDWWSVISVGVIGLSQAIAGVSLAVFSFGAGVGLGLSFLQEGIGDLITCVKDGIINRNFSWKQWGIQKAISLAVTIACAGFSALKAAARTVRGAATTVKNAVQYGMKELWTKAVKEGIQIGGKKLALEVVERAAIEITLPLVNYALAETIVPIIENIVQITLSELIESRFRDHKNLRRLMDCDSKRRNQFYANQLKQHVFRHLNEATFQDLCKWVGRILLNKTSSSIGEAATKAASVTLTLAPIITELNTIVVSFENEIDRLGSSTEVQDILDGTKNQQQQTTGLNYVTSDEQQAENEQLPLTVEEFCSGITEQMGKMICQLIQGMLVPPLIASGVDYVLSDFNKDINIQLSLFHQKRTVTYSHMLTEEEIQDKVNAQTLAAAKQEVNNVRNGAPGRIHHIGFISQAKNRRIRIYDEQGRVEHVIGDDTSQAAIEIVHHGPSERNGLGHWTIKNGENAQNTGEFTCLFDAICEQIGCTGEELRQETAAAMEANRNRLAATMYDVEYLEKNYSEALYAGGSRPPPRSPPQRQQNSAGGSRNQSPVRRHLTFEEKHLRGNDATDDSAPTNENEAQTTIVLNEASPRTRHSIIQMRVDDFHQAVQDARNNNQCRPGRNGEIKIKVKDLKLTEMTWQMDSQRRPMQNNNGEYIYEPPRRITADVEVVYGNNGLIHLEVLSDPASTARASSRQRP